MNYLLFIDYPNNNRNEFCILVYLTTYERVINSTRIFA